MSSFLNFRNRIRPKSSGSGGGTVSAETESDTTSLQRGDEGKKDSGTTVSPRLISHPGHDSSPTGRHHTSKQPMDTNPSSWFSKKRHSLHSLLPQKDSDTQQQQQQQQQQQGVVHQTTNSTAALQKTSDTMILSSEKRNVAAAVQERLAAEVLRKLTLATKAEEKEDRDIVCSEVFADITGELNTAARDSTGALYQRWYEVLAPYFCVAINDSEALLVVCRQLWGQPFTAPIFTLLLHQWLLVHPEAGGADERLKHLNILVSGAHQLFIGDIETDVIAFKPLYCFFTEQVVMNEMRVSQLPGPARDALLGLAAAFMPYYWPPSEFASYMHQHPEDADFFIDKIVVFLNREVRAEQAVVRYLDALMRLQGIDALLRMSTRVRLQGEIYALTQPGGPRYASRAVNKVAFMALDSLFPHGRRTRRMINFAFRFLHPQEWFMFWFWWDLVFWWVCCFWFVSTSGTQRRGFRSLLRSNTKRSVSIRRKELGLKKKVNKVN